MQSSGGLAEASYASGKDAILSGPAGGVIAVAEIARLSGLRSVIGLDMGGTSTGRLPLRARARARASRPRPAASRCARRRSRS
jgi:hypothetical protein